MFKLSIHNTVWRFYLMMAIAIIAVYTHQVWLIPVAMLVAVSAILGYQIGTPAAKSGEGRIIELTDRERVERRKVS